MKKLMLMATALTLSGAALAQNTTAPKTNDPQGTTMPDPAADAPADAGTMQGMQNDPAMQQPTQIDSTQPMQQPMQQPTTSSGTMSTQGNSGNMPQGNMPQGNMSQGNMSNMSNGNMAGMQPGMASGTYPRCSATVTDRCMQVAGSSRSRRRR